MRSIRNLLFLVACAAFVLSSNTASASGDCWPPAGGTSSCNGSCQSNCAFIVACYQEAPSYIIPTFVLHEWCAYECNGGNAGCGGSYTQACFGSDSNCAHSIFVAYCNCNPG